VSEQPDFAEQYSTAERIRIFVIGFLIGGLVVLLSKSLLFPWFQELVASAPCRNLFGFEGLTVLWYGVLVGIPLHAAILLGFGFGWRGYKILRDDQVPPIGEKVLRPTRIRRGSKARLIGYLHYAVPVPFLALSIWGVFGAAKLSTMNQPGVAKCTVNPSVEARPNGKAPGPVPGVVYHSSAGAGALPSVPPHLER
jgi:hypothetical protein